MSGSILVARSLILKCQRNLARSAATKSSVGLKWYRTIIWIALNVDTLKFFGEERLSHFLIACTPHLLRKKMSFESLRDSLRLQSAALPIFFSEFALPMKTISQALASSVLDRSYEVLVLIISRSWTRHHYCVPVRSKRLFFMRSKLMMIYLKFSSFFYCFYQSDYWSKI